jgi:CRISPR-associated protein Csx17
MGYLKALGVFRIVSEQADPGCRAAWQDGRIVIFTKIGNEELIGFFADQYAPSPLLAPWGARSGFFKGSSESSARKALERIEKSQLIRLQKFKAHINAVRSLLTRLGLEEKATDDAKIDLLFECRKQLPDTIVDWLDSCYALFGEERRFPPMLGTGGNEGSGSYVSLFAQQVVACIIDRQHDEAVSGALFGSPYRLAASGPSPGHFNPQTTYGPNGSQGFSGGSETNHWEYLFALEGTLLWTSGVVRRSRSDTRQMAVFPFTTNVVGAGSQTLAGKDGFRPKQAKREIAEIWTPLWERPLRLNELKLVLAEGRSAIGTKQASNGVEFSRAVASFGVDRGISSFGRYTFLMRNGQSFMAIPNGRFEVRAREHVHLLREADDWINRYRRACGEKAPARFNSALRRIDSAVFDYCRFGGKERFQNILIGLGHAERELAISAGRIGKDGRCPFLQNLSPDWTVVANDGSPEFEIAAALAGIRSATGKLPGLRCNMEPVGYLKGKLDWVEGSNAVVWNRGDLCANLVAVLERRLLDAQRLNLEALPISSQRAVDPGTIAAFIAGEVDDQKIERLMWGLLACRIEWQSAIGAKREDAGHRDSLLPRCYPLLKAALAGIHPDSKPPGILNAKQSRTFEKLKRVKPDPRLLQLIQADRLGEATALAGQNLRDAELTPARIEWERESIGGSATARRLAAALLFTVSSLNLTRLMELVSRREE